MALTEFQQRFVQQVQALLDGAVAQIVDEEIKAAQQRVDQRVREAIAAKAISVAQVVDISYHGSILEIRIRDPDNPHRRS